MIQIQLNLSNRFEGCSEVRGTSLCYPLESQTPAKGRWLFSLQAWLPIVALLFCLQGDTEAVAQSGNSPSTEVMDLVQRFIQAQKSFDPPTLKKLTADNYIEVSPLGEVESLRSSPLRSVRSGR
jgi:hypothetical protein